jgi:hypothetical protein
MSMPLRLVRRVAVLLDWAIAFTIVANDFYAFLPSLLFLMLTAYVLYRIGYHVSTGLFRLLFNKSSLKRTNKASHLFAVYLLTVFLGISVGSPPSLGLISSSELLPATLFLTLVLGGAVFSYLFTEEMLKQTDMQKMEGPIPSFWNKLEKTGRNEDFASQWNRAQQTPSKLAGKVSKMVLIHSPSLVLIFIVLMSAELLYLTLFFSILFDAILVAWLLAAVWARARSTSAKISPDAERGLTQTLHSGYYRLARKTISVTIALVSTLIGTLLSYSSFIIASFAIPYALERTESLEGLVRFIVLILPLVSYQLYYWSLLLRRSSSFLRASRNLSIETRKVKKLPVWAAALFATTSCILPAQELLLGHRFFSTEGKLSFAFILSPSHSDLLAILTVALFSILALTGLVKMLLKKETCISRKNIVRDNILYGVVLASVWFSVTLQLFVTGTSPPQNAVLLLCFSIAMLYLPDFAEKITLKFYQRPRLKSAFYYGIPILVLVAIIDVAAVFSIIETLYAVVFSAAFVILFVFVLWLDLATTKS